jgi:outer membrane protein assembly factor BamD (BamD/ComL family)
MKITRLTLLMVLAVFMAAASASTEGIWYVNAETPTYWALADQESDESERNYEEAVRAYERARALLDSKEWEKAVTEFEEVAKMQSRYADASL